MTRRKWYAPTWSAGDDEPGELSLGVYVSELPGFSGDGPSLAFEVRPFWADPDELGRADWWRGSPLECFRCGAWFAPNYGGEPGCEWRIRNLWAESTGCGMELRELEAARKGLAWVQRRTRALDEKLGPPGGFPGYLSRVASVLGVERVGLSASLIASGYHETHPEAVRPTLALGTSPICTGSPRCSVSDARAYIQRFAEAWAKSRGLAGAA